MFYDVVHKRAAGNKQIYEERERKRERERERERESESERERERGGSKSLNDDSTSRNHFLV
jgi:hypothetical protein